MSEYQHCEKTCPTKVLAAIPTKKYDSNTRAVGGEYLTSGQFQQLTKRSR